MAYKNTVAIIGAAGTFGAFIANRISAGPYRLLLMDDQTDALVALQNKILSCNKLADINIVNCCKDASWEADIIIVAVAEGDKKDAALQMKEVATCKTVINIHQNDIVTANMQMLLPKANVVNILIKELLDDSQAPVDINGGNSEAVEITVELLKEMGMEYKLGELNAA